MGFWDCLTSCIQSRIHFWLFLALLTFALRASLHSQFISGNACDASVFSSPSVAIDEDYPDGPAQRFLPAAAIPTHGPVWS